MRDALRLGNFAPARGIELAHDIGAAAPQKRRQKHCQCGVRIKRRGTERSAFGPVDRFEAARRLPPAHEMRVNNTLGRAGRAAGIDDVERIADMRRDRFGDRAFFRHPFAERGQIPLASIQHDDGERRQIDAAFLQLGPFRALDEQMRCTAVSHHRRKLLRRCRGRQWSRAAARAHRGEINQSIVDPAGAENRDGLSAHQAVALECRRDPLDQRPALSPAEAFGFVDQHIPIRVRCRPIGKHAGPGAEFGIQLPGDRFGNSGFARIAHDGIILPGF